MTARTKVLSGLDIAHRIEQRFPGAVEEAVPEFAMIAAGQADRSADVPARRRGAELQVPQLADGVDRLEWFEVAYHLESFKLNQATALKVRTFDRENPKVPSAVTVWQGAHLQEREAYDLMGIYFEGHPDLRRLFLWDGFRASRCARTT